MGKTDDGNALVVGVLCYGYVCSAWCRLRGRWLLVACNFSLHYVLLPFLLPTFVLCHVCCRSCCRSCCSCCHHNVPLPRLLLLLLLSVAVEKRCAWQPPNLRLTCGRTPPQTTRSNRDASITKLPSTSSDHEPPSRSLQRHPTAKRQIRASVS